MSATGFVVLPGEATVLQMSAPGRSAALMLQSEATAESVMMFEETVPAGTAAGPYHLHHDSDEVIYVVSGEITSKIGDRVTVGGPGTCAFIPRGVAHAWKNTGAETARILFMYTPGRGQPRRSCRDCRAQCPDQSLQARSAIARTLSRRARRASVVSSHPPEETPDDRRNAHLHPEARLDRAV